MKADRVIDYKGISESAIEFIWEQAEMLCPVAPESLIQGLVDERVRRGYSERKAVESLIALANDYAGSTLTLREVFGTIQNGAGEPQIEGKMIYAALSNPVLCEDNVSINKVKR